MRALLSLCLALLSSRLAWAGAEGSVEAQTPGRGSEVWECQGDGRWATDGRCYAPAGTCVPIGPRTEADPQPSGCRPGDQRKRDCSCAEPDDPFLGKEVWACRPDKRWESDGRCYARAEICNTTGPRFGGKYCEPGADKQTDCLCPRDRTSPGNGTPLGLGLLYFKENGYHIVAADLSSPDLEIHVNNPRSTAEENMRTVESHAQDLDADVAINANFFGGAANHPCGAARGSGRQFLDAYPEDINCVTTMGWSQGGHGAVLHSGERHIDEAFMSDFTDLATGGGRLLQAGKRSEWNSRKLESGRGCTAIGLSADHRRFLLVVTDRRKCTGKGLQDALLAHGASDAIHLDGGGSSKLWLRARGYVNDEPEDRKPPVIIYARARR